MKALIHRLVAIGSDHYEVDWRINQVKLFNKTIFITIGFTLPISLQYLYLNFWITGLNTLFLTFSCLFFLYLNHKNKSTLSIILYSLSLSSIAFINGYLIKGDMNINLLLLVLVAIPPLISSSQSHKLTKVMMAYCALLATVFSFFHLENEGLYILSSTDLTKAQRTNLIFGVILLTTLIYKYYSQRQEGFSNLEIQKQELLKNNDELEKINIESQKALHDKHHLLSILFHDLNNPLSIALLRTDSKFQEKCTVEKQKDSIQKVNRSLKIMRDIIQNIAQLESIRETSVKVCFQPVSLKEVFEIACFIFQDKLEEKSIKLIYEGDQNLTVHADKISLSNNIINNFVSNAIKFSPNNSIIKFECIENPVGEIAISIIDQGIGIPEDIINNLYQFETKTNRPGTNGEAGTGMPIANKLITEFNGSLEVTSQTEGDKTGTTFTINLKKAS